jgi:hypothetical protein
MVAFRPLISVLLLTANCRLATSPLAASIDAGPSLKFVSAFTIFLRGSTYLITTDPDD